MSVYEQIEGFLASLPEAKQREMRELNQVVLQLSPGCELWFTDGKNGQGKIVANPNIGYGRYTITYADGSTKDFYRVGLCANTTGISVYILGLEDKTYLARTYGSTLGKASITGYCIKFKSIKDINLDTLSAAILMGLSQ